MLHAVCGTSHMPHAPKYWEAHKIKLAGIYISIPIGYSALEKNNANKRYHIEKNNIHHITRAIATLANKKLVDMVPK